MQQTDHYSDAPRPHRPGRPAWLPTLVTVLLLPLLVGLGLWQLDRADQKRSLQADFAAAGAPLPLETAAAIRDLDALRRFQPVSLRGRYLPGRQFLQDSMVHDGAAGYHVLTPFVTTAGPAILVNRGWVAQDYGGALPDVTIGSDSGDGPRTVTGRIARLPRPAIDVGETAAGDGWPRLVHFPQPEDLEPLLAGSLNGGELLGSVLLLDPAAAEGYVRAWQPTGTGPERHLAYALQWFAFAATLAVIWLVMFLRRRKDTHG
jgi:surfeit locus 1 family protein